MLGAAFYHLAAPHYPYLPHPVPAHLCNHPLVLHHPLALHHPPALPCPALHYTAHLCFVQLPLALVQLPLPL